MKPIIIMISWFMLSLPMTTHIFAADKPVTTIPKTETTVNSVQTTKPTNTEKQTVNQTSANNSQLPTPVGKVIWIKGTFKATMPNNEVRILQKDSVIYLHDTLTTDNASQAQIAFTDNTLMTFRADTKFVIDEYAYQAKTEKNKGVGKYVMSLVEGGFRTVTGLIAKDNPDDYKINTPVATIGVRGTDYTVYFHKGELYLGYFEGKPCVNSGNKELCLDSNTPYANVPSFDSTPVPMTTQPEVLKETLYVVPATVGTFVSPAGTLPAGGKPGGTISSFCIQ